MATARRLAGCGTLLLAVLGLVVCLGGIVGAWAVKSRVDAVGDAVFGTAKESLGFVELRLDRVKQVLDGSRRRVSGMATIAERLKNAEADARKECEPLLQTLAEVQQELKSAESWLEASHAIANTAGRVSDAVVSSAYAAAHPEFTGLAVAREVQEFADAVSDALARLEAVRLELTELRDTGKLALQVVARVVARVADLDEKLASMCDRIEKLDAKVSTAKASCADLNQSFCWWTLLGAVTVTVILVWYGFSQIVTIGYGWRLVHAVPKS